VPLLAAAGEPDIAAELREGHELNGRDYRVHVDGYTGFTIVTTNRIVDATTMLKTSS
jgi:arylsulfatase